MKQGKLQCILFCFETLTRSLEMDFPLSIRVLQAAALCQTLCCADAHPSLWHFDFWKENSLQRMVGGKVL